MRFRPLEKIGKKIDRLNEKQVEIFTFFIPFIIFALLLANGLNVFDFIYYANLLEQSFKNGDLFLPFKAFGAYGGGSGGLSRNFLYIVSSYPFAYVFSNFLRIDIEFALNIFSTIVTALSVVFIYKTTKLFFDRKTSLISAAIYLFIPFIFFNGINATTYSLQLLTSSIWIYFLLLAVRTKSQRYGIISSLVFVANAFVSLSGAPLIVAHIYGLTRIKKKPDWVWLTKNFAILAIVLLGSFYFSFVNRAYPTTFDPLKILFLASLFVWESINGLSVYLAVFVAISAFYLLVRLAKRKADDFDWIFLLSFGSLLPSLIIFHFIPIANFTPIFAFLPILFVRAFARNRYFKIYVLLILVFALIKIAPIAYQFHTYPHPHKEYSMWINDIAQGSVILAGHECPWIQYYTNLTFVCRARDIRAVNENATSVIVTEEYFKNENQMEFDFVAESFKLPFSGVVHEELEKFDLIANKTVTKVAGYPSGMRSIEDPYQWLYTVYPRFYESVFFNLDFLKPEYAIYSVSLS